MKGLTLDQKKKKTNKITDEMIYEISDFFKIFGDSTRLKILLALEEGDYNVTELCDKLSMTKSAISHQLKGLKDSKLVKYKKIGKNVIYSLDDYHVRLIIDTAREHLYE